MRRLALLVIALGLPIVAHSADPPPPAVAVSIESGGLLPPGADAGPRFLTVVWSDGRIVWSRDQQSGGPPYLTALIDKQSVQALLAQFDKRGVFKKRGLRRSWLGPDSPFHAIFLSDATRRTRLETWHELAEDDPNLVVVNGGITPLNGRDRDEVIRNDTREFQHFRQIWADLRTAITALIPPGGDPYSGPTSFKLPR